MLRKLLKYEIRATSRLFVALYLALIAFTIINRLINPFKTLDESAGVSFQVILNALSITVYFVLIIGVLVMTLVIMIQRFYKSLLRDEGYLMFTLPVEAWQHIITKLLTAVMWTILSGATVIVSVLIISRAENIPETITIIIKEIGKVFGTAGYIILPLYALAALIHNILVIYDSIAIGHQFANHKIAGSFAVYCVFYIINQIASACLIFIIAAFSGLKMNSAGVEPPAATLNAALGTFTAFSVVMAAIHFTLTNYMLKKRLNLE